MNRTNNFHKKSNVRCFFSICMVKLNKEYKYKGEKHGR